MRRRLLAGSAALCAVLAATTAATAAPAAPAGAGARADQGADAIDVAVIGDAPYGPAQVAAFPDLIGAINADPKVRLAMHLGDIKNGSTRCDDSYYAHIAGEFATFKDPLVYTPGDNEWTDCHRPNNGAYNPLERLAKVREVFFAEPGHALGGRNMRVEAQDGLPENQMWYSSRVQFAAVHVVGSNNSYAPWTGRTAPTPEQRAEADARIAADLAWIDRAFAAAAERDAKGVVLAMQADTFEGSNETLDGFDEIVDSIGRHAAAYGRPVLLLQGDTHTYVNDQPYAQAPNLRRVVVEGETVSEWLRLHIDPNTPEVFSWTRETLPA